MSLKQYILESANDDKIIFKSIENISQNGYSVSLKSYNIENILHIPVNRIDEFEKILTNKKIFKSLWDEIQKLLSSSQNEKFLHIYWNYYPTDNPNEFTSDIEFGNSYYIELTNKILRKGRESRNIIPISFEVLNNMSETEFYKVTRIKETSIQGKTTSDNIIDQKTEVIFASNIKLYSKKPTYMCMMAIKQHNIYKYQHLFEPQDFEEMVNVAFGDNPEGYVLAFTSFDGETENPYEFQGHMFHGKPCINCLHFDNKADVEEFINDSNKLLTNEILINPTDKEVEEKLGMNRPRKFHLEW